MTLRIADLILLSLAVGSFEGRADDVLPKAPPVSKYARMAAHSPFAPPTLPTTTQAAPPPPPVPGWADNLTATMIMRDGDKFMVTVVDSQNPQHLYLTSDPDKLTQMAVASVKLGANRDEAPTVTLSKGKEFAQVKYDSGASSPGGNNQLGGGPPIPGGVRNPGLGGPPIPGAQPFHPPGAPTAAQVGNPIPTSAGFRRPLIRAPAVTAPPAGTRPTVSLPNPIARPNSGGESGRRR